MHHSVMMFSFARMVVTWKSLLVHWNNLRRSVQPYLDYDYDRCLDLILIGAAIRPVAGAEPWKRNCLVLYRMLGFYQLIMGIAKVGLSIRSGNDTMGLCTSTVLLVAQITIYAKVYILGHYHEVVRQAKIFVNSNCSYSRDPDYDATVRRGHARVPGKITLIILGILCCDQVILSIPNSARDYIFGIPEQFHVLGATVARLLQETYVLMIPIFWGCGYFSGPLTIMPLLNELKHELMIVARGFETVAALEYQNNVPGTSRGLSDSVLMLKHLKKMLGITVKQHVELLR
ncbi:uncharacterized protein LOC135706965 [Ochlerotatus camptorhynchus]|uniref:uncharacterized protein LOC135706965 n=1 Tax=Ochlerotatus camptorhynchus TaxID=644619 RepID=UPI0031CE98C3